MKERLDVLLVKRAIAPTRAKAKIMIMEGNVFVNNQREDKAGSMFKDDVNIEYRGNVDKYVSRGGKKLEKAVDTWGLNFKDKICMDIGSSTGGFTDCMLQNDAPKVYAIDVGTNQLAWKLRNDERVVVMEKTNIRHVTPDMLEDTIDFSSVDVAFISLDKVLPVAYTLLSHKAEMVCLVKPQFEAGREQVGNKGVVRDPKVHIEVLRKVIGFTLGLGFKLKGLSFSPIKGPEGNIEYLMYIEKDASADAGNADNLVTVEGAENSENSENAADSSKVIELSEDLLKDIDDIVAAAHNELD
ncbi:MAG: TlyA family RNA methyltransferase [Lachnospiraceae bacterium]|nr:TlyA family RNA methyltransferase [Lachnospiraceae bacterium]